MTIDPVSLGITVALTAANMAMTASRKIEGPRLSDTKFNSGDYGAPLFRIWGMRRISPPIFQAEDLKEVKRRRKTKGGKYNEYTYYGTWAVALAAHEIDAVRRIWFDTHLVYDMSGAGPVTPFDFGSQGVFGFSLSDHITIYSGTMEQEPDPRMQATVEAKHGTGSCPAYHGIAYIVFKDIPLEKLGNRIPQVSVEVVSSAADHFPSRTVETAYETGRLAFMPDYSFLLAGQWQGYALLDSASGAVAVESAFSNVEDSNLSLAILSDGTILAPAGAGVALRSFSPEGSYLGDVGDTSGITVYGVLSCVDSNGGDHWITQSLFASELVCYNGARIVLSDATGTAFYPASLFPDDEGGVWVSGRTNSTGLPSASTTAVFWRINGVGAGPDYVEVTGLPSSSGTVRGHFFRNGAVGQFVFSWNDDLYAADSTSGAVLASNATLDGSIVGNERTWRFIAAGASTMWVGFTEVRLSDLTVVRALDATDWGLPGDTPAVYDPINHALITTGTRTVVYNYLDRVGSNGVLLGDIVSDVCLRGGIAATELDVSALTQTIPGYSVSGGSGKDWLGPLLDLYDVDPRPHGFRLQFVRRGGAAGATIESDSFALPEGDGALFTSTGAGGTDLPAQVMLQFANTAADQQPGAASSPPLYEANSQRTESLDMGTLALSVDEARQLVGRFARRERFDAMPISLTLPASYIALEPADVHPLDLRGVLVTARLTSMVPGDDRRIVTEWKRDDTSVAQLDGASGAAMDGRNESTIAVPLLSKGFVLDVPLLTDADDNSKPLLYMAAAPYAAGSWPGATIFEAVDGEYSEEVASVTSSFPAAWGYANEVLDDADANLWDRASSVNVTLQYGTLTGTTEAAIDADPARNLMLIGDELVNFTSATLEGDGSWTLSGFKRGRRGTEWATAEHADRDVVLLLDTAQDIGFGLSDVGTAMSFKAITVGRSSGFPVNLTFTGASLKPYAPCHLGAVKESNGDWTLSWVRRTRVGGAWTSGTGIPLSEASEEYELDLSDGVDTVTKTVTSATTYTWTQADQITDVGAEVMAGDLTWSAVQISDAVDRGFVASATA